MALEHGLSPLSICVGVGVGGLRAWSFRAVAWMPLEISGGLQTTTLVGGFKAITNGPLRLNGIISSLVRVERGLWLAAKGVTSAPSTLDMVSPSDMAVCPLAVILEVSQIAGLATPYIPRGRPWRSYGTKRLSSPRRFRKCGGFRKTGRCFISDRQPSIGGLGKR